MIEKLKMEQNPLSETVEKIREICPAAVTRDGKIDFEELKTSLATDVAEDTIEKYEFTWVGKNAAKAEANRPIRKTLRPVVADSKDWDNTKNLYIEGDNLDALKLLQESYLGKVKMIFIDPPYNTGNDFVYCDNFKMGCAEFIEKSGQCDADGNRLFANTKTNGRFHSDWCSMMYPRLKIARDLLTDDGSIFISIDYNEVANLRKIMDEIFGEDNFQREIIWRIGWLSGYKTTAPNFIRNHDTIVFYSKNATKMNFVKKYIENADFKPLIKKEPKLTAKLTELGLSAHQQADLLHFINHDNRPEKYPLEDTWNSNEYDDLNSIAIVSFSGEKVSKILDVDQDFKGQKSIKMLQRLLESTTLSNDLILDFFAGTSSTAHAVMQLNAEDGGNRRFIMVQLPEETDPKSEAAKAGYANICEIGKERIRRAGEKIKAENPDKDLDVGFRVLRVDSDNMADIAKRPSDITQGQLKLDVENIVPERSDLDLLFGVMVDCGLMLDMPIETKQMDDKTYYVVNHGDLVACFEKNIPEKLIYEIARMNPVCAVFRDSSFAEPKDKINLAEIFKNITGNDKCVKVL